MGPAPWLRLAALPEARGQSGGGLAAGRDLVCCSRQNAARFSGVAASRLALEASAVCSILLQAGWMMCKTPHLVGEVGRLSERGRLSRGTVCVLRGRDAGPPRRLGAWRAARVTQAWVGRRAFSCIARMGSCTVVSVAVQHAARSCPGWWWLLHNGSPGSVTHHLLRLACCRQVLGAPDRVRRAWVHVAEQPAPVLIHLVRVRRSSGRGRATHMHKERPVNDHGSESSRSNSRSESFMRIHAVPWHCGRARIVRELCAGG